MKGLDTLMDLTKLEVGLKIKNYKALCELLGVKPKAGGDSKKAHLKEMGRYFKYYKQGNAFVITEIYNQVLDKIDGRSSGGNAIFKDDTITTMLKLILAKSKGNMVMYVPKHVLHEQLSLVNGYYHDLRQRKNARLLYNVTKADTVLSKHFFSKVDESCESVVKTGLNKLKKQGFIEWSETRVKVIVDNQKDGSQSVRHIACTDEEVSAILEVEKAVCNQLGYANTYEVSQASETAKDRFYKKVQYMLNTVYEIKYTYSYKSYKIIYGKRAIKEDLKSCGISCIDDYINKANDIFINAIMKKFERSVGRVNDKNLEYEKYRKRVLGIPKPQEQTAYALSKDDLVIMKDNFMKGMESLVSTCVKSVIIDKLEQELVRLETSEIEITSHVYEDLMHEDIVNI